jgi:phosphotransferase system HPr (HPr) family protein
MRERRVTVQNTLGLHARAAAQLVRLSSSFSSKITLARADNSSEADAKSILSVLTLAASVGTELILKAEGSDEEEALHALENLIIDRFGEK